MSPSPELIEAVARVSQQQHACMNWHLTWTFPILGILLVAYWILNIWLITKKYWDPLTLVINLVLSFVWILFFCITLSYRSDYQYRLNNTKQYIEAQQLQFESKLRQGQNPCAE